MKLWEKEFGSEYDVPNEINILITNGIVEDVSWHNDTSPRFLYHLDQHFLLHRELWCDHPNLDRREMGLARFRVYDILGEDEKASTLYEGEDFTKALLAFLFNIHSERNDSK